MPIYEYRCRDCQTSFSRLQRMGASAAGLSCPSCGSVEVEKRLSGFAAAGKSGAGASCGTAPGST